MVQNHLLDDCFENGKGFLSKLIPDQNLDTVLCRNFVRGFWLNALEHFKTQIFNFYDTIVKDVIMVIFIPNWTQATLLK